MPVQAADIPYCDIDLFADGSLRDLGAVVKLGSPDVYAISRFADVREALRLSDVLVSGEGVGFSDAFNAPKGNNVIQTDGDQHRRMRAAVMRPLKPERLDEARPRLKAMIAKRIDELASEAEFDAM